MLADIIDFLISLWKKLRTKGFIKKSIWLIVVCLLIVLIPLSIAICYANFTKAEQKNVALDVTVCVYDANGKLIATDTTQEDIIDTSPLVNLFYNLSNSKVRAQKPTEFAKKQTLGFSVTYGTQSSFYKCYFEEDAKASYIESENGSFFSPDSVAYSMFLSSNYSESVYKDSVPPTLQTLNGDTVLPNQVQWNYILSNKAEKSSQNYELTTEALTYRITGAISFNFSQTPDVCTITVKNLDGTTVFFGSPEKLATLNAEENSELLVSIDAKWEPQSELAPYGEQHYDFKIICADPSTFHISKNEASGGEVILLTVKDVENINTILYAPTTAIPNEFANGTDDASKALKELYSYTPIFAKKGSNAYALLPIPANIPNTSFSFYISCGISRAELTVNLKSRSITSKVVEDTELTSAQRAEFSRILFYLNHSSDGILLINDDLILPDAYDFTLEHSYYTKINDSFTLLGTSYSSDLYNGTAVKSAETGIVSAVGYSPLLGNYVIIDHGMGLCSWYCGLSDVSVLKGSILKTGDTVGKAGNSSLLCENGVNIICTVGGILIDPEELTNSK